jgi:cephalosporin-C deacetylase-like acetyl esterase
MHTQATALGGQVDSTRIALWGVSYGGGHVLVSAARFGTNISAVIANEPYASPEAVLHTAAIRGVGR